MKSAYDLKFEFDREKCPLNKGFREGLYGKRLCSCGLTIQIIKAIKPDAPDDHGDVPFGDDWKNEILKDLDNRVYHDYYRTPACLKFREAYETLRKADTFFDRE